MSGKVELTVIVSKQFYRMLQGIAEGMDCTVEAVLMRSIVSTVEAIEVAGEDPELAVVGLPETDCDPDLLALAMGAKKKPFLSPDEIQALSERFSDTLNALEAPAATLGQTMGACRIIDFAAWKSRRLL